MYGLVRLKRALTMLPRDTPIAQVPFAVLGKSCGAVVVPNLTNAEAETLMCVVVEMRENRA